MEKPAFNSELRLCVQMSIPFDTPEQAQSWYAMLKENAQLQSPKSILNGQIMKQLEPCCNQQKGAPSFAKRP